jgi:hypothetical protein
MGMGGRHIPFNFISDSARKSAGLRSPPRIDADTRRRRQFGVPSVRRYLRKQRRQYKTTAEKSK